MKQYDLYLFDFDGTLVNTYESLTYVFEGAYSSIGVKIKKEDVARLMRTSLEAGYESVGAPKNEISYVKYVEMIVKLLDDQHTLELSKPYDEVTMVLQELLHRGHRLGIVTSNSKHHVIDVLRFMGFDEKMFDVIVGNAEASKRKPNPEPVLKALELTGVSKDKACYVGDALDDMKCGQQAGIDTILIDRYNEYQHLQCIMVNDLNEIL